MLVEQDRKTADTLREILKILGTDEVVVHETDALQWIKGAEQPFDIIFLDPPFGNNLIEKSLLLLVESACVTEQTLIYVESDSALQTVINVEVIKQAKAGQVNYTLLKTVAD